MTLPPLALTMRALRAEHGLCQLELAIAMGSTDASYLGKLENGRRMNPGQRFMQRYVRAFTLLGRPLTAAQRARLADALLALPRAA